jgi:hypothetical protein
MAEIRITNIGVEIKIDGEILFYESINSNAFKILTANLRFSFMTWVYLLKLVDGPIQR